MRAENHGSLEDCQVTRVALLLLLKNPFFILTHLKEYPVHTPEPIDEEYTFEKGLIVSSTNLKGIITYANRKFCEISGYSKDELTGKNHNIVRHPDMPKAAFKEVWNTIQEGKEWSGLVKNLRKDGRYYWVYSHITPVKTDDMITGYTAARRPASETEIEEIIPVYRDMLEKENHS